jgi:hypothetical protein
MQVIQYFPDGSICFNWEQLPENVRSNIVLRDKIYQELRDKFKIDTGFTSKLLFEINRYAINRIITELKIDIKNKKALQVLDEEDNL